MNEQEPVAPVVLFDGRVDTVDAMGALGARIANAVDAGDLIVLTGPLGAGKTTLTRGLGAALGARGQIASPTFVLARTHPTASGVDLVHVDAYRLSDPVELDDLDLDWDASVVVVEWGRGMVDAIADSYLDVEIERSIGSGDVGIVPSPVPGAELSDATGPNDPDDVPDEPRRVVIVGHGPRWAARTL
ncbi:tRNA (adenosine(37)-N6)-threonylcarbamoyltransferase complex ATPase subunit type 1 TsaE [Curtobacterium ammoniigenes]|uniref:tRNA (adenosine(37)-N6)-threonylcarbamoyltransferase complex ATPase subunit type 1 TsaE n=1 Tax=Curtobacterium ammoniigenes TaxID=395387 RepID=UPI000AB2AF8F|nr:tRNA (adenosine(37)-N6)-threonylcarbamoyltransferase complex ATPase subunit type 1 TsaE [Curtobacterium ammoniigenes]